MNLPEWPKMPKDSRGLNLEWLRHTEGTRDAALARMEALMEYAEHFSGWRGCALADDSKRHRAGETECTCGLDELRAACERRE